MHDRMGAKQEEQGLLVSSKTRDLLEELEA